MDVDGDFSDGCRGGGYRVVALRLMRLALPLLDGAGCEAAATRLQQAIDQAETEIESEPVDAA